MKCICETCFGEDITARSDSLQWSSLRNQWECSRHELTDEDVIYCNDCDCEREPLYGDDAQIAAFINEHKCSGCGENKDGCECCPDCHCSECQCCGDCGYAECICSDEEEEEEEDEDENKQGCDPADEPCEDYSALGWNKDGFEYAYRPEDIELSENELIARYPEAYGACTGCGCKRCNRNRAATGWVHPDDLKTRTEHVHFAPPVEMPGVVSSFEELF